MSENRKNDDGEEQLDPINGHLPPCYRLSLPTERNRLEQELLVQLDRLDPDSIPPPNEELEISRTDEAAEEDRQQCGYTWNVETMCIKLQALRKLRYRLSPPSHQLVVSRLWSLTMREMSDAYAHAILPAKVRLKLLRCLCLELERLSDSEEPPLDLVLPWRPVWDAMHRLILRGEGFVVRVPEAASILETSLRDGLANLCSAAREFFPPGAAEEMYAEIEPTLFNTDSKECLVAAGMLVTIPSAPASSAFYAKELPRWLELWARVDHCPEWDSLWARVFCRAQKNCEGFNWSPFVRPMHALAMRIFRLSMSRPKGGERTIPSEISYLSRKHSCSMKIAKILVGLLGWGEEDSAPECDIITPFNVLSDESEEDNEFGWVVVNRRQGNNNNGGGGGVQEEEEEQLSGAAVLFLRLMKSFRTLFHPSNSGSWTNLLGAFISWYTMYLAKRIGYEREQEGGRGVAGGPALSKADVLAIVRELLPVAKQLLYTKSSTTSAETILSNLVSISPRETSRVIIPLLEEALDPVHSVMHAHQAPSAMRAVSKLIQPLMYPRPYLAEALPILLEWALPGIDPNDQAKTSAACKFFSSVCCWIPLTGKIDVFTTTSTSLPPSPWADETTPTSSSAEKEEEIFEIDSMSAAMERLPEVLPRWGLSLLERLLTLIEQRGEPSKKIKKPIDYLNTVSAIMGGGDGRMEGEPTQFHAALMHMNAANDRWQSWGIFSLSKLLFSQMDEQTLQCATRTLMIFCLENSSCASAAKDVANLLRALVAASPEKGLRNFLPALAEDFETLSPQTKAWRLRLMSGAVRNSGVSVLQHVPLLRRCLDIGFQSSASSDKRVLKSACKLFRRLLSNLMCRYAMDTYSRFSGKGVRDYCSWQLCAPAACNAGSTDISWHEPCEEERDLAADLVDTYVVQPLSAYSNSTTIEEWRRGLKIATYALSAIVWASVEDSESGDDGKFIAMGALGGWGKGAEHVTSLRHWTLEFVHYAIHNFYLTENGKTKSPDQKVLKELMEMGQLASARRSSDPPSKVFNFRDILHMMWRGESCGIAIGAAKARLEAADKSFRSGDSSSSVNNSSLRWNERVKMLLETSHMNRSQWISFAESQHAQREVIAASIALEHTCKTPLVKRYVDDLFTISSHPHATVRSAAQQSILSLGRAFTPSINKVIPGLTTILTVKSPPLHSSVTGAIYVLVQHQCLQLCTESWPQLRNFLLALCDSEAMVNSQPLDHRQKLSVRLQILLVRYLQSAEIPPIRTPSDAAICKDLLLRFIELGEGGGGLSPPCDENSSHSGKQQDDRLGKSRHWRYQITATCCAIHLLARAGQASALPIEVWEQVMKGIAAAGGEGQPLQQLSLMALGHLFVVRLSQPEAEQLPREVLLDLVLHRSHGRGGGDGGFITVLVRAVSHLHLKSGEDGSTDADSMGGRRSNPQWSFGVGEILRDARKRYRFALRCAWGKVMLPQHRKNGCGPFVSSHARLIGFLVKACGMDVIPALLQAMHVENEKVAEEDRTAMQCTVAEVLTGAVWGVLADLEGGRGRINHDRVKDMWSVVLPFVETQLGKANMDMQLLWNQAIARMIANQSAEAVEPLTAMLEAQALNVLRGWRTRDDFATQAKWLFMVQAPLLELPRKRAAQLGLKLSPELIGAASQQFKLCREKIGTCLGIITCFTSVDKEWLLRLAEENVGDWNNLNNDAESGLRALSISKRMDDDEGQPMGTDRIPPTKEEQEKLSTRQDEFNNRSQTFIHWILSCLKYGDASVYILPVIKLLPAVMYAVRSRKVEVNSAGKNCAMQLSTSIRMCCRSHLNSLPTILSILMSFTTHKSWQVRIFAASLCCQFYAEHYLVLSEDEASELARPIRTLLGDNHREVQDHCCNCLTLQLSFMDFKPVSKLARELILNSNLIVNDASQQRKRSKIKGISDTKKSRPIDDAAKSHQACVLGLSSIVLAQPYEMAPYTPMAVAAIARHADAVGYVNEIVTRTLAEFKRTRTGKDWEEQRQCFTTAQLDAYHDASAVPSYFS